MSFVRFKYKLKEYKWNLASNTVEDTRQSTLIFLKQWHDRINISPSVSSWIEIRLSFLTSVFLTCNLIKNHGDLNLSINLNWFLKNKGLTAMLCLDVYVSSLSFKLVHQLHHESRRLVWLDGLKIGCSLSQSLQKISSSLHCSCCLSSSLSQLFMCFMCFMLQWLLSILYSFFSTSTTSWQKH